MADPAAAAHGAGAAPPPPPDRTHSSTSLSRLYHGANGGPQHEDLTDPSLDFCNAFWGQGDRGYEVVMARLRGAARTVDELKVFWKERAAIEEEYAKKLSKLAKMRLGGDEIGDLAASLQTIQAETSAQASYHLQLSTELHQTVEQPTTEFGNRLANLRKGQQASIEKSWRNKGLQEGHVAKARERYEKDCLKLNSYTANMQLVQGRERDDLEAKMDKTRRSIVGEEQDFRNFVSVLEQTTQKWENEWRNFCDLVQDIEEERLVLTKDIVWSYANAVSQVCVEDDSSCERVREKLEMFEPVNDMVYFVKGWGTGDQIPDPPRFINYGMGEYPTQPTAHVARFRRLSDKPPLQPVPRQVPEGEAEDVPPEGLPPHVESAPQIPPAQGDVPPPVPRKEGDAPTDDMQRMNLGESEPSSGYKPPFGIPMPGMGAAGAAAAAAGAAAAGGAGAAGSGAPSSGPGDMGPPPVPASLTSAAGLPSPSARDVQDNEDPMARALAELRRDPPGPNSVRRAPSQRRPESLYTGGSIHRPGSAAAQQQQQQPGQPQAQPQRAPSPSPSHRTQASYQAPTSAQGRSSMESGLIPPASGHTAAALAKSMADFENRSQNRNSVNYQNYADNLVGAHPSSRPSSPSGQPARAPSPAMMQPPKQPTTHIADDVVPRYHQAFPGERSRSRPASVYSSHSRAGSVVDVPPPSHGDDEKPREGFVGIGAGNAARSPSPGPGSYRSPSPNPSGSGGVLGQPNLGIALDASGGVAQDSMAEQYRRQYEQQRQHQGGPPHEAQPPQQPPQQAAQPQTHQQPGERHSSVYSNYSGQQHYGQQQPQQQSDPYSQHQRSHSQASFSQQGQYGAHPQAAQYGQQQQQSQYGQPPAQPQQPQQQQQQPQAYGHYGQPQQGQPQHPQQQAYAQQQPPQQPPQQQPQQQQYPRHGASPSQSYMQPPQQGAPPAQQHPPAQQYDYRQQQNGYGAYPQQGQQQQPQQQGYRVPSPQPQQHDYRAPSPQPQAYAPPPQQQAYRAPSPQPQAQPQYQQQQQQQQAHRNTPSPQPNQPPANIVPTGQWASNGLPVLFYVRALYDYQAQSSVEFDFQEGDIIAVTSHPEDGWWSGELLDEARNMPGRTDFPSNFVTLF